MTRQILVPLDGSSLSESVLPHAIAVACATASDLALLRVVPVPLYVEPLGGMVPEGAETWETWDVEVKAAADYLNDVARKMKESGLVIHTTAVAGDVAGSILDYMSRRPDIKLVAIGTHGRSGIGRWIFGSIAERVLHASPIPVMMVHSAHAQAAEKKINEERTYKSIIVPLDGSKFAEQAVGQAKALAASMDSQIELLSVVPPVSVWELNVNVSNPLWTEAEQRARIGQIEDYLLKLAEKLRAEGYKVKTKVAEGEPAEVIIREADNTQVDLIVMTTHGRNGIQRMWLGSVAMKVVQGTTRPVILERPTEHVDVEQKTKAGNMAHSIMSERELAHRVTTSNKIPVTSATT